MSELTDHDRHVARLISVSHRWKRICPDRYMDYRLDNSPQIEAAARVREWLDGPAMERGDTLIIYGATGTGKTALATSAMREVFERDPDGYLPLLISAPVWLDDQRPGQGFLGDIMNEAQNVPLLIVDDIGAERASEWIHDRYYLLFSVRYDRQLPTIITTNLDSVDKIAGAVGERVMSRIVEGATLVRCGGADMRRMDRR